jgi:phage shock protein A
MSGNKGGVLSRVFGGSSKGGAKSKTAQTPQEAIQQLRDVEDVLNKKVEHLEAKINEETSIARRDARTNKRNALNALKRKKRLEKTLQQIDGTLTTLEYQREALQVTIDELAAFVVDRAVFDLECIDEWTSVQRTEKCHECAEERPQGT